MEDWIAPNEEKKKRLHNELLAVSATDPEDDYDEMLKELKYLKISKQLTHECNKSFPDFNEARLILFSALSQCFDHNNKEKIIERIIDPEIENQIKKAGRMLYEYNGSKGMRDTLVWHFIPKSLGGEVEILWNGIGDWVA